MKFLSLGCTTLLFSLAVNIAYAENFPLKGKLDIDPLNISGLVVTENFAAVATDEGNAIQILPYKDENYHAKKKFVIHLTDNNAEELDLEGLAWQAPYLYAIGSHSKKRKKYKSDASDQKNLQRMSAIIKEPARHALWQIKLSEKLKPQRIKRISIDDFIQQNTILEPFTTLPSKENGIDIEGIAVSKNKLWLGFRGPVIRGNFASVLQVQLNSESLTLKKPEHFLLDLNGFGIRDLAYYENKLFILAGAVNELPKQYMLYDWKPETAFSKANIRYQFSPELSGKPEAIAFSANTKNIFWMAQDGIKNGAIQSYQLQD